MRDLRRLGDIVTAMVVALRPSGIPVTVKIRSGWDEDRINYCEAADTAVEAGAAAVTLHARTRAQQYEGTADWSKIADLASRLAIPVFGSGDANTPQSVAAMVRETGCAGVMIARGAMGNPFIFHRAKLAMLGLPDESPTVAERVEAARKHLELSVRFLGESTACLEFRKQFCSYTKGSVGGAELRKEGVMACTAREFEALFARWLSA